MTPWLMGLLAPSASSPPNWVEAVGCSESQGRSVWTPHGRPSGRRRAFIFHPKPGKAQRSCSDLWHRNAHWSFIIGSRDGERMLEIQKKHSNV